MERLLQNIKRNHYTKRMEQTMTDNLKEETISKKVYQLQCGLIGARYAGATISNTTMQPKDANRILEWLKGRSGFLVLMGKPGCGKTHLCSALLDWSYRTYSPDTYFLKESKFMARIISSFDMQGDWRSEVEYQIDHDFFILDDVGSTGAGKTDFKQSVIFDIVNSRYENRKPTVFSTNYNEQEIKEKLGERTYSRLFAKENTIIDMFGYPDMRMP